MKENQIWTHAENAQWQEAALKKLAPQLEDHSLPVWAREVTTIMPDWGFEIHCQRWVEGLDAVLYSLEMGTCYSTPFGRYGDNTASALNTFEQMANAVEQWMNGLAPRSEFEKEIHNTLGKINPEKKQAAACFAEITRRYVVEQGATEAFLALGKAWRERADSNRLLQLIFSGEGLDRGLCDGGGYWAEQRLFTVLRIIGGRQTDVQDLLGSCNYSLRHVFRDDRERMRITKGYLIGVAGYLDGSSIEAIRRDYPEFAGYAIKAYTCLSKSKLNESDKRTIARKFYITTQYWYVRALIFAIREELWEEDTLLPEIDL